MKKLFRLNLLPFSVPQIDLDSLAALLKTVFSFKVYDGLQIKRFEEEFAAYIGVKHAICFSSARFSLYLVYKYFNCLDKLVILPAYTCIPALDAARWAGARPYFLDIDLNTYNPKYDNKLSKLDNIGAISLSYLYGLVGNIDEFLEFGKKHKVPIIEDAAIAVGATYKGKKVGSLGDAAVFSLQSSKILTSWKGGVVTTNNDGLYAYLTQARNKLPYPSKLKLHFNIFLTFLRRSFSNPLVYGLTMYPLKRMAFSNFLNKIISRAVDQNPSEAVTGKSSKELPRSEAVRFTNLQAAIARASFRKIDAILDARRRIEKLYRNKFSSHKFIEIPTTEGDAMSVYGRYPIRVPGISKFVLQNLFFEYGIETAEYYPYMCPQTAYMKEPGTNTGEYPNAKTASRETLLLPFHVFLKERDVAYIRAAMNKIFNKISVQDTNKI